MITPHRQSQLTLNQTQ